MKVTFGQIKGEGCAHDWLCGGGTLRTSPAGTAVPFLTNGACTQGEDGIAESP
jgi:hypothetical protein